MDNPVIMKARIGSISPITTIKAQDPNAKDTHVLNLRLAVDAGTYINSNNERCLATYWQSGVIWNSLAEHYAPLLRKGMTIVASGILKPKKDRIDRNGNHHTEPEFEILACSYVRANPAKDMQRSSELSNELIS